MNSENIRKVPDQHLARLRELAENDKVFPVVRNMAQAALDEIEDWRAEEHRCMDDGK